MTVRGASAVINMDFHILRVRRENRDWRWEGSSDGGRDCD